MSSLVVVAIDFGTTYSGWAFSYKDDYERDPLKITAKAVQNSTISLKVPTCILIKSDGTTPDSFGYDAEDRYAEICETSEQHEWFFFKRFKMMLFKEKGMTRHDTLEDETGKKLPAMRVFSLSIDFLRKDVLDTLSNHIDGTFTASDIHWVLTVPAIWNDAAKQFMREAAQQAGIPGKNLSLCLEPEAASIFCRHLPVSKNTKQEASSISQFSSGTKYLVLDAGGGTVDITVHEVTDNGNLKELHKASGGVWGGTKVDEAFEAFLSSIVVPYGAHYPWSTLKTEDFVTLNDGCDIKRQCQIPTCILIKSDGKTTDCFGCEAEDKYAEICEENDQHQWFFFKRFKMMLFKDEGMSRQDTIEDETGKKLPAIQVFSLSIEYLVKDVLDNLNNHVDSRIDVSDIQWVLTVPAIWNDAAKQFMREAAQKAGVPERNLTICLEPEAASVYGRHLPVSKDETSLGQFSSGTKFLVLDAGGGTVDITVHVVNDWGNLKELHKPNGGAWGGTKVDEAYEAFLTNIVGPSIFAKFKTEHLDDYIDLCRNFEKAKRQISPTKLDGKVTMCVIPSLSQLCKDMTGCDFIELFLQSKFRSKIKVMGGDKLRIDAEVFADFFKPTVSRIISHLAYLLTKPVVQGCAAIIMVGGFSESPMLHEKVKSSFRNMKVIVPDEAGLAVLKGAVIFGHEPTTITERICKYTYGDQSTHMYSASCNHPEGRVEKDDNGEIRCYDIFSIYVKAGQSVKVDEEQPEEICRPITHDQTAIGFCLYASLSRNPQLTTEDGCNLIGKLTVPISDTSSGRNHEFGISFIFGGTEIVVKVLDKESGEIMLKSVDFLG